MNQLIALVLDWSACQVSLIANTRASSPALPQLVHTRQKAAGHEANSPALTPIPTWAGRVLLFCSAEVQGPLSQVPQLVRGKTSSHSHASEAISPTLHRRQGVGASFPHICLHIADRVGVQLSHLQGWLTCAPANRVSSSTLPRWDTGPAPHVLALLFFLSLNRPVVLFS